VREVKLLRTNDGVHWEPMQTAEWSNLLALKSHQQIEIIVCRSRHKRLRGQGFDTCEIPSLAQMQIWWNRSPYNAVNLYIGGISRACSNSQLSAPSFRH